MVLPGRLSRRLPPPLPVIEEEDDVEPPPIPAKSQRRFTVTGEAGGGGGGGVFLQARLDDSSYLDSEESLPDRKTGVVKETIKDREWVARRGGWRRLLVGAVLLLGSVVGIAVGLAVGLKRRHNPPSQAALSSTVFPGGSYSFTTALASVSTGCTSNPYTWRCFPFATYDPAKPELSAAVFSWIIRPASADSLVISSSDNPFAPSFSNITLQLLAPGQHQERFTFNLTLERSVAAGVSLEPGSNEAAFCSFNQTVMSVTIWTRAPAEYPGGVGELDVLREEPRSIAFAPWPFAVEVRQVQRSEDGSPECRTMGGRPVGGDLSSGRTGKEGECRCEYRNFGLLRSPGG
ncbi:hypothetical protein QBC39DRAFT_113379 [Podospora conica]|nr:hypothetical protein QBC39DRAFT_113379 [Schizothecium conicum]